MVQETFKSCVESRDKVADPSRFHGFIMKVAYHVLCRYLRKHYIKKEHESNFELISIESLSPSPSSAVAKIQEQQLLLQGLREIPINHQVILELHYWEDMTTEQIGEILSVPVGTIRSRLKRARQLLEKALTRIARSPKLLESTLSRLDDWARECGQLVRPP